MPFGDALIGPAPLLVHDMDIYVPISQGMTNGD